MLKDQILELQNIIKQYPLDPLIFHVVARKKSYMTNILETRINHGLEQGYDYMRLFDHNDNYDMTMLYK